MTEDEKHQQRMANIERHQYPKGTSGNPAGRPKGSSVTDKLKKMLEEPINGSDKTLADVIAKAMIKAAAKGDVRMIKELLDRVEGKVSSKLELDGEVRTVVQRFTLAEKPKGDDGG